MGIRRRLVAAASNVTGPRFRALAASSVIATSAIIGSALAGGDDSGFLAALLSRAQGAGVPAAVTADAAAAAAGGPTIPPPPVISGGPSAPAPSSAPQQTAQTQTTHATTTTPTTEPEPEPEPEIPDAPAVGTGPIKHVFVISLSSPGYDQTFGEDSLMPYLNEKLRPEGQLLSEYSLLTTAGLPNRIAAISGQPPNALTKGNCSTYTDYAADALPGDDGIVPGAGCIYPVQALTVSDQIAAGGLTWRAYMEDMEGQFGPGNCIHPGFGEVDEPVQGGYASTQNPFAYFHSLLDLAACSANDMPFDTLAKDLKKADTTANYVYISPNRCKAGELSQCEAAEPAAPRQDPPTTTTPLETTPEEPTTTTPEEPTTTVPAPTLPDVPGVIADATERVQAATAADAFLEKWVPQFLKSPAYKKDGLLVITFGAAQPVDGSADPTKVGTLLLSNLETPGLTLGAKYDPYSLLRSTEDLFGLTPLANAGAKGTLSFAAQVAGGGD